MREAEARRVRERERERATRGERESHVAREQERESATKSRESRRTRECDVVGCASYIETQEGARSEEAE